MEIASKVTGRKLGAYQLYCRAKFNDVLDESGVGRSSWRKDDSSKVLEKCYEIFMIDAPFHGYFVIGRLETYQSSPSGVNIG